MKTRVSTTIEPSDVVVVEGWVYRADIIDPDMTCRTQCAFWDAESMRCRGFCLRWANGSEVVFRRIMDARLLATDAVVTVIPYGIGEEIARLQKASSDRAKLRYYERKKNRRP